MILFSIYISIIIIIIFIIILIYIDGYRLTDYMNKINKDYIDKDEDLMKIEQNSKFFNISKNWILIRDEYINYCNTYKTKVYRSRDIILPNAGIDIGDIPWENIILRIYNKDTELIKYFPITYNLIKDTCSFAMFSILPPGKIILPHFGPYNGIIRYHLGLIIPKDKENCFIIVNNKKYIWSEGNYILFDDTLYHYVANNTDETRVVLFLDLPRTFNNKFINYINKFFLFIGKFNTTVDKQVTSANNLEKINEE
jgi:aspartyl/asparaginyl beta-hydroxylase (cupin superfamily)